MKETFCERLETAKDSAAAKKRAILTIRPSILYFMATVILFASSAFAQSQRNDNPTVKETLRWMQTTLESGAGDYSVGHEVRSVRLKDFFGCKVLFSYSTHQEPYANGEPAPEPNKTYHVDYFFDLGDIDPSDIAFSRGSGLHTGDEGLYESPSFLTIRTRNDEKKITIRLSGRSEANSRPQDTSLILSLDSVDQDYITRFAKAFKHAVESCGGKPSLFAGSHSQSSEVQPPATAGGAPAHAASRREDIPAIAKAATGAVVSIIMSDKDGNPIAQGSGFFVSKDGLVVTNYHVIAEGSSAVVKLPDGAFYVVDGVLASDKTRDIAVVRAHGQNFRTLPLGNSDRVHVGEEVVAVGNPLSLESTVSNGIVSAVRAIKDEGGDFLQITAPISPGSSGGPLFNMAGEVIGITTMYLKGGENLNFAIPINDVKPLLPLDSAKLRDFPNEVDSSKKPKPSHGEESSPPGPVPTAEIPVTARDFYQQLFRAGGFSGDLPSYVCFSDDPHSTTFFTFRAYAYDPDYYSAQAKVQAMAPNPSDPSAWSGGKVGEGKLNDEVTPEMMTQFNVMEARQRTAPYVTFLMKGWLESFPANAQQFFRSGGRILEENVYDKGVKTNTLEYEWNGSSWSLSIPSPDPKAYSRTSKILGLSIEPTTMRYADSTSVTITIGWGDTAATDTSHYGPWTGICEKVSNPK